MQQKLDVRIKIGDKVQTYLASENIKKGDNVIIENENGLVFATVEKVSEIKDSCNDIPFIVRKATKEDIKKNEENLDKAKIAIRETEEFVKKLKLDMNIINANYSFDGTKVVIEFLSDDRVDFRDLIKELVLKLKVKIELRQIGIREHAKIVGGIGVCGRVCCCKCYLNEFQKVSMKMAKVQGLALNPNKISGTCGRLMCCLEYENPYYCEITEKLPKMNSEIITPDGKGMVTNLNILKQIVSAKIMLSDGSLIIKDYPYEELKKYNNFDFSKNNIENKKNEQD